MPQKILDWQLYYSLSLSPFLPRASWSQHIYPSSGYYHIHIKDRRKKKAVAPVTSPLSGKKRFPRELCSSCLFFYFILLVRTVTWPPLTSRECRKPKYLVFQSLLNGKRRRKGEGLSNEILDSKQCLLQEWNSSSQRETRTGLLSWPPPALSTHILHIYVGHVHFL